MATTVPFRRATVSAVKMTSVLKRKGKGHLYGRTERDSCSQTGSSVVSSSSKVLDAINSGAFQQWLSSHTSQFQFTLGPGDRA